MAKMTDKEKFWQNLQAPPLDKRNCTNCVNSPTQSGYDIRHGTCRYRDICSAPHRKKVFTESEYHDRKDEMVDKWEWNGEDALYVE